MSDSRIYLGDAVYARIDEYGAVILTVEDGIRVTNTIVLELDVLVALRAWLDTRAERTRT